MIAVLSEVLVILFVILFAGDHGSVQIVFLFIIKGWNGSLILEFIFIHHGSVHLNS